MFNIFKSSVVLAISIAITACGGGGSSDKPATPVAPTQPTNTAPTITVENVTVNENTPVTITASASDVDGDELTYSWSQISGDTITFTENGSSISFDAPEIAVNSEFSFEVSVSDGSLAAKASSTLTVNNVNQAPTISVENITSDENTSVTVTAFASDADGDALTYSWTQTSGDTISFTSNGASITFTAPEITSDTQYNFEVTVSDSVQNTLAQVSVEIVDADDELIEINNTSRYTVSADAVTENKDFNIENFGFHTFFNTNTYTEVVCYPTPTDCSDGEEHVYWWEQGSSATGDFNGDGYEDLIITGMHMPHTTFLTFNNMPLIFINDGKGHLMPGNDIVIDYDNIGRTKLYHTEVRDFNQDGVDDILVSTTNSELTFESKYEKPLLLLSDGNGRLYEAPDYVIGDRSPAEWHQDYGGHDLSAGDVNGDGYPDFYTGTYLGLSNGDGTFSPKELSGVLQNFFYQSSMSSILADFNNDGYADIIRNEFNKSDEPEKGSNIYVVMSNGTANIDDWTKTILGKGVYGTNTKHNHAEYGDFNNDGNLDFVIAQTRAQPYYSGRALDIYMGNGDGTFTRTTDTAIDNSRRGGLEDDFGTIGEGEGFVQVRDINGDGWMDIFDSVKGVGWQGIYINNKDGTFTEIPPEKMIQISGSDLSGYDKPLSGTGLNIVNIDNKHGLDFVSSVRGPAEVRDKEFELIYYEIHSKKALGINSND